MDNSFFQEAVRTQRPLRLALAAPSGGGKTFTALLFAYELAPNGKVAAIDTENKSMSLYAGKKYNGKVWRPMVKNLTSFSPENYIEAIHMAEAAGFEVLIIDSLTHAWTGKDGVLEMVDLEKARRGRNDSRDAWRTTGTPSQNKLIDTMIASPLHIIVTMRVKTSYVEDTDDRGRKSMRKIGLEPIQREGVEYEFDVLGYMDEDNTLSIKKSRFEELNKKVFRNPGHEVIDVYKEWMNEAAPAKVEVPWAKDATKVSAFLEWAAKKGADAIEAAVALEVDNISDYTGTNNQAADAVKAYIAKRDAK
jgi:hypothetical protein